MSSQRKKRKEAQMKQTNPETVTIMTSDGGRKVVPYEDTIPEKEEDE